MADQQPQGFTRDLSLPRDVWAGYIKDYDGGTLMECTIHPRLPYTHLVDMLQVRTPPHARAMRLCWQRPPPHTHAHAQPIPVLITLFICRYPVWSLQAQKAHLDSMLRGLSNSHVVRPGLPRGRVSLGHARVQDVPAPLPPGNVPGVCEAGWVARPRPPYRLALRDGGTADPCQPAGLQQYLEGERRHVALRLAVAGFMVLSGHDQRALPHSFTETALKEQEDVAQQGQGRGQGGRGVGGTGAE